MFHARPTTINSTFRDNVNTGLGGGVYNLNGDPSFIDCRFLNNSANSAAGSRTCVAAQSSRSASSPTTPPRNVATCSSTKTTIAANAGSG
jgi:hypothetical protein